MIGRFSSWATIISICALLVLTACGPNPEEPANTTPAPSGTKVQSVLLRILLTYQTTEGTPDQKKQAALQYARSIRALNEKDEAIFELTLDQPERAPAVQAKITSMGGKVQQSDTIEGSPKMRVAVPFDTFLSYVNSSNNQNFLADLAAFTGVKTIDLITGGTPQDFTELPQTLPALQAIAQSSRNEGIKVMGADRWHAAGFKGKGVKIGVVDSGFRYYEQLKGTALPSDFSVKDINQQYTGEVSLEESVHGTAVAEVISSIAPEATLYAASIDGSDLQYKASFDYLAGLGCSIISMSLGAHVNAGDGTSAIELYIERLRREKGIVFLIAAGNSGASHYTAYFNPDEQGFHQFLPGVNKLALRNDSGTPLSTEISLIWEQWGQDKKRVVDLDLFLTDTTGKIIPNGSSQDRQTSRNPVEIIITRGLPSRQIYYLQARQAPGTPAYTTPFRVHLFARNVALQLSVPQLAISYPASSKGALAVGAIQWNDDKWAYYSSQGPLPNGYFKPEISAPTGISTRAYEEDGRTTFSGTSAATPEAAGVAALLKGANPALTAPELEDLLREQVKDLPPTGADYANGVGRIYIGETVPQAGIKPTGKTKQPASINTADLQFPIQFLRGYPSPVAASSTANFPNVPTPLPTRVFGGTNGANNSSLPPGQSPGAAATALPASTAPVGNPTPVNATVAPANNITFRDNFKDASSGLPNRNNTLYQNGNYRIQSQPGQLSWVAYPTSQFTLATFSAQVTLNGVATKADIGGLVFWQQSPTDYHLLAVSGNGQYAVYHFVGGNWREVQVWTKANGWLTGQANTIRVLALTDHLVVIVNNQIGKSVNATGSGSFGFAAGTGTTPNEIVFSSFSLVS